MNKLYSLFLFILFSVFTINAENLGVKNLSANQEFKVLVYENSDSTLLTFGKNVNNRGILGDSWKAIKGAYRNTALGTVSSVSADLLSAGIGIVVEALRDKKGDWIQQVAKIANIQNVYRCSSRLQISMRQRQHEELWISIA